MDILSKLIKFMLERLFLVWKHILTKKWKKENNMLLKLLDQLEKVLSEKMEIAHITWKIFIYLRTLKFLDDLKLSITLSMKK